MSLAVPRRSPAAALTQAGAMHAPGLALAAALAAASWALSAWAPLRALGLSALTLAMVLGIALGNTGFARIAAAAGPGVDLCRGRLLRLGIVLYGFRVSFHDLAAVGWAGWAVDAVVVATVFATAAWVGTRWLKLERETALLIGAGSAICGAAAVMATEPVLRARAEQVSVAVATVVVFGSIAMFLYPALYPLLGLSERAYGLYVGSTVHEVAQVVVAGRAVGDVAASTAVIEKMLRVMLLAPFLLLLSLRASGRGGGPARSRLRLPWFALAFVAVSALHPLLGLPPSWSEAIAQLDTAVLAMAMAALGLRTQLGAIRQAGARPLLLAALLFVLLTVGGYALNLAAMRWSGVGA
ncbi:YeiH family protein [Lysobacter silvisoli]|uniref:Putative sulfate exporter family transporter n=1 Tax=Lysobacter silvisoli TaxID=2293254 RepID=A0A371JYN2_9GAMM|nr:putative sulfate exporter family transporter [Lysobacter silvisoli]RDZ26791.1 putative sulfate exporter family transporter [Lysobacter silvisoli]